MLFKMTRAQSLAAAAFLTLAGAAGARDAGTTAQDAGHARKKLPVTPSDTPLKVSVGQTLVVRMPCKPTRFYAGNTPYDVNFLGEDLISLVGLSAGRSTVIGGCENGDRVSYPITVQDH